MSETYQTTRRLRRAVLKEFEEQQKTDAEIATKMRNCVLANTNNLLKSLAAFLESYENQMKVDRAARQVFSTIAPSVSLDEWLSYRERHNTCLERAVLLGEYLKTAQKNYDEVSPLGVISKLFKDHSEKRVFDALKDARDTAADALSSVQTESRRLEDYLREKSAEFLRQAMRKESLEFLRNTSSPAADFVRDDLDKMTKDVRQVVEAHVNAQSRSLARVQEHVAALAAAYIGGQNDPGETQIA